MSAVTPDPTPERIAAGLSPAQKRALLWLPAEGASVSMMATWWAPAVETLRGLRDQIMLASWAKGLGWSLTPLGVQVRAAVLAMQEAGE